MDPINPIMPGSSSLPSVGPRRVESLPRISRERDRPKRDREQRQRRPLSEPEEKLPPGDDEQGRPHVDIRV
ncbi:MAG TPA: hypothetical protein VGG08_08520 [Solirubrobacteraceae bacterium]|jgi:hypothetical protein